MLLLLNWIVALYINDLFACGERALPVTVLKQIDILILRLETYVLTMQNELFSHWSYILPDL